MEIKDLNDYTVEDLIEIKSIAMTEAHSAGMKYFNDVMKGNDYDCCGFAWVSIYDIKGNTKIGKRLKAAGVEQTWDRSYQIWNPANMNMQSLTPKEKGARAAAKVFTEYGFKSYAGSRMD